MLWFTYLLGYLLDVFQVFHLFVLFFVFVLIFIGVQLIYNVVLLSAVQQSESVILNTYINSFFRLFSHIGNYRVLSRVPCVTQ